MSMIAQDLVPPLKSLCVRRSASSPICFPQCQQPQIFIRQVLVDGTLTVEGIVKIRQTFSLS